jgi:D-sedoheptulose 7-phosphate isomerase
MINFSNYLYEYVNSVTHALKNTVVTDEEKNVININAALERWVDIAKNKRDGGAVFFFAGNGASASMAEHFSHDCFKNADLNTYTCSETAHITAISNDISFEEIFAYRISKICSEKDALITISSSGNSPNVLRAIETAQKKRMFIVTLSGKNNDNKSRQMGSLNFYVALPTYGFIESAHATLLHCWLDMFLDKYMQGRK